MKYLSRLITISKSFVDDIRDVEKPGNTEYVLEKLAGKNDWFVSKSKTSK